MSSKGRGEVDHVPVRARHDASLREGRAHTVRAERNLRDRVRGERSSHRVFDRRLARVGIRLVELRDRDRVCRFSHHAHRHRGAECGCHERGDEVRHLIHGVVPFEGVKNKAAGAALNLADLVGT